MLDMRFYHLLDRKSTRLNSSHSQISYAVFCLKKKHQCIGAAFGGKIVRAPAPVHGKVSEVRHDGRTIYDGLPNPLVGTRYHSLIIDRNTLPEVLEVSAQLADGTIMGVRHKHALVEGVQFHPESVLTAAGEDLLRNFLRVARGDNSSQY